MSFRNKLKSLITKENDGAFNVHIHVNEATTATNDFMQQESMLREFADDPTPDNEVIESIEKIYFSNMEFDASSYELEKLPEVLIEKDLDSYRNTLRRQLQAVSKEMSKKILEKQTAYVRELDRVMDLEANLKRATVISTKGRVRLEQAKQEIVVGSLGILAKNRKKLYLEKVLESLRFIKTLQQTDMRLKELLQENNYASAIQLCLECQHAAVTFHQYKCINELSSNLQELLEQIEIQLDVALSRICLKYIEADYTKIQEAYKLLGKTQISMDQLQMHFVSSINVSAVRTLIDIFTEAQDLPEDISYVSLCKNIPLERFIVCLTNLCKVFWDIMYSYSQTAKWHQNQPELEKDISSQYDKEYICKKLEQGKVRIWQDIQSKIKVYVSSTDFSYFKYDDFIHILDLINRLITIGENFSMNSTSSQMLQDCLRVQTENYFKAYHRKTIEELHMFLENEAWELCPVKSNFTILDMQELHFIKTRLLPKSPSNSDISSGKTTLDTSMFNYEKTPFDCFAVEDTLYQENVYGYEDDDDDEVDVLDELKRDFVDEKTGEENQSRPSVKISKKIDVHEKSPIVTNTTINVLRSFGKYMQMMIVLKPIAFEVVNCMSQLFEYYLYSVFTFFATYSDGNFENNVLKVDEKLRACLTRIHNSIILMEESSIDDAHKISSPLLSPMINLRNPNDLFGFVHRVIGVESLLFLSKQLLTVYQSLVVLVPPNKQAFLRQFYSQTVDIVIELRDPIFKPIAEKAIDYNKILSMMASVKWDPKEIMSQHNRYIDIIVNEYEVLNSKLQKVCSSVPIPADTVTGFWSHIISQTNKLFVDGFSSVKRCTNEGRALMLLDFQQFLMKIEKITKVKPIPERDYVENYIKAFYLVETDLENWLKEHQEYTPKQLNNLVTCGTSSHIGKKMKQKMLSLLEDLESKSSS
ncbi:syndetin isoform X1 [Hydra vulgaris]|uniref:syndetin isoform X1 n=1 Tax=Hydra vulgaris TaxID=6087 RepID=UPI001F5EE41D|nr:syndetin [Hydra vulgaris]